MNGSSCSSSTVIEQLYQEHSRRVLATLIRLLGDFALAEECLQEAFVAALRQWPVEGIPDRPHAWLISTAHRRGIDQIRRNQTARCHAHRVALDAELDAINSDELEDSAIEDDLLRLLFTCCHPALAPETRVALTLREVCGLTTEQVANALLQKPTTVAQKIVRAKRKIRDAGISYSVPSEPDLAPRLPDVLMVIYLVFNQGYAYLDRRTPSDINLSRAAIQLGESLARLLPYGEVFGLVALMHLQHSRHPARWSRTGVLITLEQHDRTLWDQAHIRRGREWLALALQRTPVAPYTLQASIAAEHAAATHPSDTDWQRIARLYDMLRRRQPTAVVKLNHAVAVAMSGSLSAGLHMLEELSHSNDMAGYALFHAARADLVRRTGRYDSARSAYQQALRLTVDESERRYLTDRLLELGEDRFSLPHKQ